VPAVGVEPLPARAVTLRPEAPEPDAGFLPRSAAHQASGSGLEADAEDLGDALEILINGVVPIVVEAAFTIPGAGLVLRRFGKFVDAIDCGFDDFRHGDRLPPARSRASRRYRSNPLSRRSKDRVRVRHRRSHRGAASSRCWHIGSPTGP